MKAKLLAILCALTLLLGAVPTAGALEGESQRAADTLATLGLIDETDSLTGPPPEPKLRYCWWTWLPPARRPLMTTGSPVSGMCPPKLTTPSPMPRTRVGSPA